MTMKYRCLNDSIAWFNKGGIYECVTYDESSNMNGLVDGDGSVVYVNLGSNDWELVEDDEILGMFIFKDHGFSGKFVSQKYEIGRKDEDGKLFVFCQKKKEFTPSNDCYFHGKIELRLMKNSKTGGVFRAAYSYNDEDGCHEIVYVSESEEHGLAIGIDSDHESWEYLDSTSVDLNDTDGDDNVNHPSHYTSHPSGVECIQITEHMGFCLGNAMKYIWRADLKGKDIEDLKKAAWYINREIEKRLKQETPQDPQG